MDIKNIKQCFKRANRFADDEPLDCYYSHALYIAWKNCSDFIDALLKSGSVEDYVGVIGLLEWFAMRVELYSKDHLLEGDKQLARMLYEWRERLFFNPELLKDIKIKPERVENENSSSDN